MLLAKYTQTGTFDRAMRLIASYLLLTCLHAAHAQQDGLFHPHAPVQPVAAERSRQAAQDTAAHAGTGKVTVVESSRIQAYMADYAAKKRVLKGYRVQIFLGDRSQAEASRRTFLQQYPDIPAYLSYLAPNFRVRVGDLRDRVAAEFLKEQLRAGFPGLYIVPDDIELPALKVVPAAATAPR